MLTCHLDFLRAQILYAQGQEDVKHEEIARSLFERVQEVDLDSDSTLNGLLDLTLVCEVLSLAYLANVKE